VTLLGNALHNMTPFRAIGANTALQDAQALHRALVAVARGDAELIQVLTAYEHDMIGYGFAAVQASLKNMKRFHATGPLAKTARKTIFRVIDRVRRLRARFSVARYPGARGLYPADCTKVPLDHRQIMADDNLSPEIFSRGCVPCLVADEWGTNM
jgi:2-polyprenyl-6-methoxyphenol hydroxylase-like FAD-dependent oxidoreductase